MDDQLQALFDFSMYIAAFLALFVGSGLLVYALALLWEAYLSLQEWMTERARARRSTAVISGGRLRDETGIATAHA